MKPTYLGKMTWDEYVSIPYDVTKSELVYMDKSPMHYQAAKTGPKMEATEDMQLGVLLHTALLEPELLKNSYIVEPEEFTDGSPINRRVKAHREYLKGFRDANPKAIVVKPSHVELLTGMVAAAGNHRDLAALMNMPGESEVVATWEHLGFKWKGRADRIIDHPVLGRTVIELKKTFDASRSAFSRQIYNMAYDIGISAYMRGFEAKSYIFVAVESKSPFPIGIYRADDSMVERAHAHTDRLLTMLTKCRKENYYPGYTDDIENLLLPQWVPAMDAEIPDGEL